MLAEQEKFLQEYARKKDETLFIEKNWKRISIEFFYVVLKFINQIQEAESWYNKVPYKLPSFFFAENYIWNFSRKLYFLSRGEENWYKSGSLLVLVFLLFFYLVKAFTQGCKSKIFCFIFLFFFYYFKGKRLAQKHAACAENMKELGGLRT